MHCDTNKEMLPVHFPLPLQEKRTSLAIVLTPRVWTNNANRKDARHDLGCARIRGIRTSFRSFVVTSIRKRGAMLLGFAVVASLIGCASHKKRVVIITVIDAQSSQPVEDATISIRPMNFFIPTYPYEHLALNTPDAVTGRSTQDGSTILEIPASQPSEITVTHADFLPFRAIAEPADLPRSWTITGRSTDRVSSGASMNISIHMHDSP